MSKGTTWYTPKSLETLEKEAMQKNTTSIKSFHYLENGSIDFSILETNYSTTRLEPRVYKLTARIKNNDPIPILALSDDVEVFSDKLDAAIHNLI